MKKVFTILVVLTTMVAAADQESYDLYLLMGQSNMAGRGKVAAQDRVPHDRVFTLDKEGAWVPAIDPIHFDKPSAGVGPGRAFGIAMAEQEPLARIGLIPCAVGGTSIRKWVPGAEDVKTGTHPYDDMVARLHIALKSGRVKGVIWHQGEADGKKGMNGTYGAALEELIGRVRAECGDAELPFLIGQLGRFEERPWSEGRAKVDAAQRALAERMPFVDFVSSDQLKDKGDRTHFSAAAARELGTRYATVMMKVQQERKP